MNSDLPILSAIVAMSENRVIGKNNQLPWHLPADLKHFKALTVGHPVLMGRKTYESIGKPLPHRTNIILSRNRTLSAPGCIVVASLSDAISSASPFEMPSQEIFVIGGAKIYEQLLPKISRIYLTIVHHIFEGDVFFPDLNEKEWQEISHVDYPADEVNIYPYSFVKLERVKRF